MEDPTPESKPRPLPLGHIIKPGDADHSLPSGLNLITDTELNKSDTLWVVMNKKRDTCLKDPGLDKAWSTTNQKIAEKVAREAGGVAVPYREAVHLVMTNPINW